jgi:lipase chaperone LimK
LALFWTTRYRPGAVLVGGVAGVLVVGLLVWWQLPKVPVNATEIAPATPYTVLPRALSLVGTDVDGLQPASALRPLPDGRGGALDYAALKRNFDYHLSTVGELSVEAIAATIRAELARSFPPQQAQAAQGLLARYLEFKRGLVDLEAEFAKQAPGLATLRARFAAMQTLRARYFNGLEEDAMFALEDASDLDALARIAVAADSTLDPAQRRARLAALDQTLPRSLREDREAPRAILKLEAQVQTLRASGDTDHAVYQLRAKTLGSPAADRLAGVDRDEQAWQQRIAAYQAQYETLGASLKNASAAEREQAVGDLQRRLFSSQEIPRLAAYTPP